MTLRGMRMTLKVSKRKILASQTKRLLNNKQQSLKTIWKMSKKKTKINRRKIRKKEIRTIP
jgi:hypothetical protein